MDMRSLERLKGLMCTELDEIAMKGELSAGDLETAHKLTDTIKNICKIKCLEDGEYSGSRSYGGEWEAHGYSRDGGSYRNGYGGRHYARGHYSRDGGYSMAEGREMLIDQIDEMLSDPSLSPHDKITLKKAMDELR